MLTPGGNVTALVSDSVLKLDLLDKRAAVRAGEWSGSLAEVMHNIADAVTQCKFEATDRHSDEVVLYRILQVGWATRRLHPRGGQPIQFVMSNSPSAGLSATLPGYWGGSMMSSRILLRS